MKIEKNEYFGKYDNDNFALLDLYMNELDKELKEIYDFEKPFFKGRTQLNYKDFLKDKKLNYDNMNFKQVFKYIKPYFESIPNWNNPGTMINVIPPVNLISLATINIANMYNPNFAQDTYAGMLINSELEVIKYLSDLIGWDWEKSHGTFTFGGKGTNLYATKIAINKVNPNAMVHGINSEEYFMITSKNGHPCHYEVCNWLGLGTESCYEIPCDTKTGEMDFKILKKIVEGNIEKGKKFLGFNSSVGN